MLCFRLLQDTQYPCNTLILVSQFKVCTKHGINGNNWSTNDTNTTEADFSKVSFIVSSVNHETEHIWCVSSSPDVAKPSCWNRINKHETQFISASVAGLAEPNRPIENQKSRTHYPICNCLKSPQYCLLLGMRILWLNPPSLEKRPFQSPVSRHELWTAHWGS